MASGASSLDSSEGSGNISHSFIPTSERATGTLPTLPLPIDYETLAQNSGYEKQPSYPVVKQPTYEGMSPSYDSLNQSQYDSLSNKQSNDNFKQQCDKALIELNTVRRQHSETSRRCDHAMKELDYFRNQHRAAMSQLDVQAQETNNLRGKYGDLLNDKQRLEREVQRLQEINSNALGNVNVNNGESGDTALMHTLRKYDVLKEEYDCLRKRYDEIISTHNATADQLQVLQDENVRLKSQSHELTQERNSAIRERNGLKQQCTAAIRQWDIALRERNDYRDALGKISSQHEEAVREMNQAMGVRVKATKDIKRLTEERNAAMHEYSLIMSERDTVHREMEKLSEDLQRAVKRAQVAETELTSIQRERHALALQAESLRREIASALLDRDRALRECSDLTRNAAQNQPNTSKTRLDNSAFHSHTNSGTGKDGSNGGQLGTDPNIDKLQGLVGMVLNPRHKERVDNLETANQELERMRKTLDKLQSELTEAHQEAEVSKRRRDWAFSERDKIVLERESIRTLCDRLRKERDRAVSDLAEALRDSDDIKKQRNEASKELKELKEKLETELEKDSSNCRVHSPITHNHSRDSAIDADLQEWESEILEVEVSGIPLDGDVGFELVGGREDPFYPNDYGIYVISIQKGSVVDGKLKVADCIVDGPGVQVGNASHVIEAIRNNGGRARFLIRRRRVRSRCLHTTQLNKTGHTEHGLLLEQGIYISKISPGSLAAKEGNLAIGDRVLSINNKSMDGLKSAVEAMMVLNDRHYDMLTITTLKHISHSGSTNSDLSSRFSPTKDSMNKNPYMVHTNKMVNSCSQTEDPRCQYLMPTNNQKQIPFDNSDADRRVYKVTTTNPPKSHEKSNSASGAWNMIFGKIEAVTGRNKPKDKQNRQSTVPESDAIAQLDFVIESYHGKTSSKDSSSGGSVLKRSKRRNKDNSLSQESESTKNRGTWPKARSNVIILQNPTGTIVQPRSKKERPPLSILLSPPTKLPQTEQQWSNRNSNPIPISHIPSTQSNAPSRHSVYKSMDYSTNQTLHFPKPVPLSIHNPFSTPNMGNYEKIRNIDKDKHLPDFVEHDLTPNRLSRNLNPSDDSLDYQTVIRDSKSPNSLDFVGNSNKGSSLLEFVPPLPSMSKNQNSLDFPLKAHYGKDMLVDYYSSKKSKSTSNKYSDNESLGPDSLNSGLNIGITNTLPSHSRLQAHLYRVGPPFVNPHPHHLPTVRYPHQASPTLPITQSQSGESIGVGYECTNFPTHSHNVSDIQPHMRNRGTANDHFHHHGYEGGTFPRKKENQRFRIPSNPSVTSKNSAGKVSTGSIERSSERGSPMPTFHVEVLSPGRGAHAKQLPHQSTRNSMPEYCGLGWPSKPLPGELRRVHIDKIQQPLGIQISCPPESGGVFVSTVNEHSVASQVGLQVGDQLLEVCGINMRSATYKLAANVLRQCGNSITMLVQYSPDKYNEFEGSGSSSQGEASGDEVSVSGSPTPRNSPGPQQSLRLEAPTSDNNSRQSQSKETSEPRFLLIEMRKGSDLGISLVGGNAVGIFVHNVQMDSPAYNAGLRTGDQILEYNVVDLRHATSERAALELAKPADKVTVLAKHDLQRYHEIKDKPGDGFFIRTGFDRTPELASNGGDSSFDSCSLCFRRDQVIFVDNTLFNGAPGLWGAWNLDHKGNKAQWGTIPSRFKVEEMLRRSVGSLEGTDGSQSRRGSTVARRSFFRRKKQRDPKELASFSNTNLGLWSDSGNLNDELPLCSYQRVERLQNTSHRPVVVLGPLWECVVDKLVIDFAGEFSRATPEPVQLTGNSLEKALSQGKILEPRKRGHYLECISLQSIKDVCDKGMHCILDISVTSIEKLHKQQIYPIVLLIKFKSTKQIKEVRDTRFSMEKVSAKAAKEMYEHALKLETEYRQHISAEIAPAGINIAYICAQLKAAVDEEQGKPLWIPSQQT